MTTGGRILVVVEELLFGYAAYVVLFDIFWGWWNYVNIDDYDDNLSTLILVGVSIEIFQRTMYIICFRCLNHKN